MYVRYGGTIGFVFINSIGSVHFVSQSSFVRKISTSTIDNAMMSLSKRSSSGDISLSKIARMSKQQKQLTSSITSTLTSFSSLCGDKSCGNTNIMLKETNLVLADLLEESHIFHAESRYIANLRPEGAYYLWLEL